MAKNTCRQNKIFVTSEVRQNAPGKLGFFSFGERWGVFDIFCSQSVPMEFLLCSHHALRVQKFQQLLILAYVICIKFYSCNLYKQPKGGDYNIPILGFSKAWFFFMMGQSKMPINQEKIELHGSSQLLNTSHKYVLLLNINVKYLHCCSPDLRSMRLQSCNKLKQSFNVWLSFAF
jgi:hypothetical protein